MKYEITTQKELRKRFWREHEHLVDVRFTTKFGHEFKVDVRVAFVDWIDHLQKSGVISEKLAQRATL